MNESKRILLVEDEQFISELYAHTLTQAGFQVDTSTTGTDVVSLAKTNLPSLILLDVNLPQIDGLTILKQLKQDPSTANIPVVMMTNSDEPTLIQQTKENGALSYLVKSSLTPVDMLKQVQSFLQPQAAPTIQASSPASVLQPSVNPPINQPAAVPQAAATSPQQAMPDQTPPSAQTPQQIPPIQPNAPVTSAPVTTAPAANDLSAINVLLIEDEDYIRDIYSRQLQLAQIKVDAFGSGMEGLQAALKNNYDLLLLDIMLPDTNGLQILKEIKQNSQKKDLPIVLLTNLGQDVIIKEGFELGADGYLIKASLTPNQIVQEVRNIMNKKKGQSAPQSLPS